MYVQGMKNGSGSNIIEDLTSCVNNLEEAMAGMTVKYICGNASIITQGSKGISQ